jgi:hypothetical protein
VEFQQWPLLFQQINDPNKREPNQFQGFPAITRQKKSFFFKVEVFPSSTVESDIIYKYSSVFIYLPNNNVTQPRTVTFDRAVTASNLSVILR